MSGGRDELPCGRSVAAGPTRGRPANRIRLARTRPDRRGSTRGPDLFLLGKHDFPTSMNPWVVKFSIASNNSPRSSMAIIVNGARNHLYKNNLHLIHELSVTNLPPTFMHVKQY